VDEDLFFDVVSQVKKVPVHGEGQAKHIDALMRSGSGQELSRGLLLISDPSCDEIQEYLVIMLIDQTQGRVFGGRIHGPVDLFKVNLNEVNYLPRVVPLFMDQELEHVPAL